MIPYQIANLTLQNELIWNVVLIENESFKFSFTQKLDNEMHISCSHKPLLGLYPS
jgi:hypothetical protein